ncbi:nucleotide-diphospho-sugar transferase [Bisporella sp. PMI_857]|nr:nucleotide-diphospho-sugar transferase [Bisporella sp. PMI_857]
MAISILGLIFFLGIPSRIPIQNRPATKTRTPVLRPGETPNHKYAFAAFLAPMAPATPTGNQLNDENHYMVGIRMLIYQLLHDPVTRTKQNIPFVVLVTEDVPQEHRDRLTKDGAHIVQVSPVVIPWIKPGRERWAHVMDKLHVFELVQYEKILLLDADHVIVKPLDGVFEDPATDIVSNLGKAENTFEDEGLQPKKFMMAGNSGPYTVDHGYPAPRGDRLNAGFVVLHPSIEMYNLYIKVASIEGKFPGGSPEQDLWNYVHDRKRNMPWTQINPDWTANTPIYNDFANGIASFHEKYWGCGRDRRLRDVLLRSRWKMEGYFDARDALLDG